MKLTRLALACSLALPLMLIPAAPAGAHAEVVSIGPKDAQVLKVSKQPTTVNVEFNEVVSITTRSLRVRAITGAVVSGSATLTEIPTSDPEVTHSRVTVRTRQALAKGRYAVEYSVTSQDGHQVSRAFGFGVGVGTSAARPSVVALKANAAAGVPPRVVLSRAAVGKRTITVTMPAGTTGGDVRLTCNRVGKAAPKVAAPFTWSLGPLASGKATASGYIPTPCRYSVSVTVNRAFPNFPSSWVTGTPITVVN